MIDWILIVNFSIGVATLILTIMGLLVVKISRFADHWTKCFFVIFFLTLGLCAATNVLEQIFYLEMDSLPPKQISLFLESVFSSLLLPELTMYLLYCSRENWRRNPLFFTVLSLWSIYIVLLGVTQFTEKIYYYSADQVYHRGPWYPALLVPLIAIMLLDLVALLRRRKRLTTKQFVGFLIYLTVPLVAMLIQTQFYGIYMTVIGTSVAAVALLLFIHIDQMEQYDRQHQENARQRASILVLQMRPHFIYNTMTSIYYLCQQDPQKAQQVILDFTSYLRKVFTSIARDDLIPFAEELEHTRAYLAVEQVRYEGRLLVKIDTPVTGFRLPALTLQPIVENAVKHGVGTELEPLRITVRTRETDRGIEIVITDTGPGFSPITDDKPHIALFNIQERLERMCGGRLEISPREEGGTVVTMFIGRR